MTYRIATLALLLAACSVAYALPTPTALPGSVPLPSYSIAGPMGQPPPMNAVQAIYRGVTADEALTSGVYEGASFYLENANDSVGVYPWGVYSEVRTQHAVGGAVALYGRLRNEGAGWGTALHAEPIASGSGTTIGVNVEVSPLGTGRTVGVNLQAKAEYLGAAATGPVNQAINLQSDPGVSYVDGIRYECSANTGLHFAASSQTTRAIWIQGTHQVGIDLGASPLRMNAGTPIQLEGTAQVQLVFSNGRIEFRNGARVLAWVAIDGTATGNRIN